MSTEESRPVDADGSVETWDDGMRVLRFERRLNHPIERVWAALTDPDELLGWWGVAEELELVEGGHLVLRWLNSDQEGNQVVLHGKVTQLDPPRLLEYDTDVHGVLRFDLRNDSGSTVLTFSSTVGFPVEVLPLALAGWHLHLNFLADELEGRRADLVNLPMDKWQRWHDQYQEKLG